MKVCANKRERFKNVLIDRLNQDGIASGVRFLERFYRLVTVKTLRNVSDWLQAGCAPCFFFNDCFKIPLFVLLQIL